ncbi:MAG: alpha/beta hydrolase [Alphaproteobacteria bacterium]|nr:alpha/beta hydrolase [Alphaproteobacteria bacterium]
MPEIIFKGPAGRLEGRYKHSPLPNAPVGIVLHPDPERGGNMNGKITYHLFQAFVQRGFSTFRFNFRGVGGSQGEFDKGEGELSDAAAALDYIQDLNKNAPYVWVAGFGFGAWIGMQLLMRRPEIAGWISIAPPANLYDFTFLAPCPTSGLILHGSEDRHVPADHVADLAKRLHEQKGIAVDYRTVDGANHFFRDHIDDMIAHVHDHMNRAECAGRSVLAPAGLLKAA